MHTHPISWESSVGREATIVEIVRNTCAMEAILKQESARKNVHCGSRCGFIVMAAYIFMVSSSLGHPSTPPLPPTLSRIISGTG